MTYTELMNDNIHTIHHSSWKRGYISRKLTPSEYPCYPYSGRFGTGYAVEVPSYKSTQYHTIAYFVKKEA